MYTPYSRALAEESNKAHMAAQSRIYPILLGVDRNQLEFVDCTGDTERNRILDGEMAVDRMVKITVNGLKMPITLTVQERFRKMKFSRYRDLTVTEWNPASGLPSELYKITSGFFVYGYYDGENDEFGEVIMIAVTSMLRAIANGSLPYGRGVNDRTKQPFITLKFNDLIAANVVVESYAPNGKQESWLPEFMRIPFNSRLAGISP